ncbi:UPF0503 protein [Apostasia shenzhenica]|uniref:UPF0503 protein n=1 Tax=Apostasia shenzhenica TaxID=1088818 RepID=A0A2I0AKS8_9ASPA|nr:UPF0503 protein [Apostasia shenzhenica]
MSAEIETHAAAAALHPHRPPSSCELHPEEPVIGFCASCLRERLAGLEAAAAAAEAPRRSTSSSLKSIFFRSSGAGGRGGGEQASHPNGYLHPSSFRRPELRRCKSFSAVRGPGATAALEPKRKSCDVRARNTLWSLFHQDDMNRAAGHVFLPMPSYSVAGAGDGLSSEIVEECPDLGFPADAVPEEEGQEDSDDIMAAADVTRDSMEMAEEEIRPMKDHIDVDSQAKKPPAKDLKEIAGSFWLAASVFSKKLRNWRRKQKLKKKPPSAMPPEKSARFCRRFRDTQSEIAVDALGRRSCDIDPRFSLDAGRISFDDPRYSWDEPRASWDGYLIGGSRSLLPRLPPMLAVVEDSPAPTVPRFDGQIPVEEDLAIPGGSSQTRDYYDDSSSCRHRRSLDRSSSTRKLSFETNEATWATNAIAKASSSTCAELLRSNHGSKHGRDSREWSSNSLRDERCESFDSGFRDQPKVPPPAKKSRRWTKAWGLWGFIHRRGGSGRTRENGVERSLSETWPELGSMVYDGKIYRSNSCVNSRSSILNGLESDERKRKKKKKKREEMELEKNATTRYSSGHLENGLLRFYLPPLNGSRRRSGGGLGKSKYSSPHSFTGSMLSLY